MAGFAAVEDSTVAQSPDTICRSPLKRAWEMPIMLGDAHDEVLMDIRDITNKSSVDRAGDRPGRVSSQQKAPASAVVQDRATISGDSRDTLAAVTTLAERARQGDGDREAIVATAKARLQSGALATPDVFLAVADRVIDANYLGA